MLVAATAPPAVSNRLEAAVVWMNQKPLQLDRPYLVKHTTQQVRGSVREIRHRVDINTLRHEPAVELHLNEIGIVELETHRRLFFDPYRENRATGSFILIDPVTNETVGAGMIAQALAVSVESVADAGVAATAATPGVTRVSIAERESRYGHRAVTVWLDASPDLAYAVERLLFDSGCQVAVVTAESAGGRLVEIAQALNSAGVIAICAVQGSTPAEREKARAAIGSERFVPVDRDGLPEDVAAAAAEIRQLLHAAGSLPRDPGVSDESAD
jgi:hypothetical protein